MQNPNECADCKKINPINLYKDMTGYLRSFCEDINELKVAIDSLTPPSAAVEGDFFYFDGTTWTGKPIYPTDLGLTADDTVPYRDTATSWGSHLVSSTASNDSLVLRTSAGRILAVAGTTGNEVVVYSQLSDYVTNANLAGYVTLATSQTISGAKTFSVKQVFTDTYANGQADFGSTGNGGRIVFKRGSDGATGFAIGFSGQNSTTGYITSNAAMYLTATTSTVIENTGASGNIDLSATGASSFINFVAGNTQAGRIFSDGSWRVGTGTTVNSGYKLTVDGAISINGTILGGGNVVPNANNSYDLGLNSFRWRNLFLSGSISSTNFGFTNNQTAISNLAIGNFLNPTMTASANNDVLVGLDINPTFNNGAFTGVSNYGLRVQKTALFNDTWNNKQAIFGGLNQGGLISFRNGFDGSESLYLGYTNATTGQSFLRSTSVSGILIDNVSVSGYIGFRTGVTPTERMRMFNNGNLVLNPAGTFTDAGYTWDVVGTERVSGNANFASSVLIGSGTLAPTHSITLPSTATGIALYNTVDQTLNYERLRMYWSSNKFLISTEIGGTGIKRGLNINASVELPIFTKTSAYTLTAADYTILADATSGAFTVTLPTAASAYTAPSGRIYVIKKIDATGNVVTIQAAGAELIDGTNTKTISTGNNVIEIQSNGTSWYIK